MILLNGRGQVGEALSKVVTPNSYPNVEVYHTWNFMDKSEKVQHDELEKYKNFLISRPDPERKLIFISTYSSDINPYTLAKQVAEKLTITKPNYIILRAPILIGKGITERLKNGEELNKDNTICIASIDSLIKDILCFAKVNYNGTYYANYDKLKISTYRDIIKYITNE